MAKPNVKRLVPTDQGALQELILRARLIYKLMLDKRVSGMLKLLPAGLAIYLISPLDLLPFLPFDDLAVVGMGLYLFVELCPQYVVEEHLTNMRLNIPRPFSNAGKDEVIVDAEVVKDISSDSSGS